jgi:hypothetical protein
VWSDNFIEELDKISALIDRFIFIAFVTIVVNSLGYGVSWNCY